MVGHQSSGHPPFIVGQTAVSSLSAIVALQYSTSISYDDIRDSAGILMMFIVFENCNLKQRALGWTNIAVDFAQLRSIWNADIQPVERHVESSVTTICPLIRTSTDTFKADSHIARQTSRYTSSKVKKKRRTAPGKMNRVYTCWWIDPCFIRCNSLWWSVMEKKKKKKEEDEKGFVYGSNTHFIRASCKKTETW